MKISKTDINFTARKRVYSAEQVGRIIKPMLDKQMPYKYVLTLSGLSHNAVNKWITENYGMNANKLYKKFKDESIKSELNRQIEDRKNMTEIAKHHNCTASCIYQKCIELGIKTWQKSLQARLNQNVARLVNEGYSLKQIAITLKCGEKTISSWIFKNLGMHIKDYRELHNIKLKSNTTI